MKKRNQEYIIYSANLIVLLCLLSYMYILGNKRAQNLIDNIQLLNVENFLEAKSLKLVNLNYQNSLGYSLLHFAVEKGNVSFVRELLARGANPNIKSASLVTPLHLASMYGMSIILKHLLKAGANPNIKDELGKTPIFYAAERGALGSVKNLFQFGADLSFKDNNNETSLDKAMLFGYVGIADYLLRRNFDFYKQFNNQKLKYFSFYYKDNSDNIMSRLTNRIDFLYLGHRLRKKCYTCINQENILNIPYIGSEYIFRWLN